MLRGVAPPPRYFQVFSSFSFSSALPCKPTVQATDTSLCSAAASDSSSHIGPLSSTQHVRIGGIPPWRLFPRMRKQRPPRERYEEAFASDSSYFHLYPCTKSVHGAQMHGSFIDGSCDIKSHDLMQRTYDSLRTFPDARRNSGCVDRPAIPCIVPM